jgi:hypothetical protein
MMMRTMFVFVFALMTTASGFAQSRLMKGTAERNGQHVFFDTVVEPGAPAVQGIGGGVINGNQLHRIMVDSQNRAYFGYDIAVEPLPEHDTYRVTFSRLSITSEDLRGLGWDVANIAQLGDPGWGGPALRTVRAGEVLTLDLLTNSSTGQKIVDYVTVQGTANPPEKLGPLSWEDIQESGTPRDFEARDAFIDLAVKSLTIDGRPTPTGSVYAAIPFMAFPDYGRFVLSLAPRPELGFRLAGVVRGNSLSFNISGRTVELVSSRRIAPGAGAFNLYVLHQTEWQGRHPPLKSGFSVGGLSPDELPRIR